MSKAPSFQFYPGDWRKDTALRLCSPAARGAWMDLLCLMFESSQPGVLITNGRPWTVAQAARECGCKPKEIEELIENGVAKVREDGAIYSSRMIKDAAIRKARAEAGSLGGNPILLKQKRSKTEANREQTLEQKPTPSSSSSSSSSDRSPLSPPRGGRRRRDPAGGGENVKAVAEELGGPAQRLLDHFPGLSDKSGWSRAQLEALNAQVDRLGWDRPKFDRVLQRLVQAGGKYPNPHPREVFPEIKRQAARDYAACQGAA